MREDDYTDYAVDTITRQASRKNSAHHLSPTVVQDGNFNYETRSLPRGAMAVPSGAPNGGFMYDNVVVVPDEVFDAPVETEQVYIQQT